MLLKTVYLIRHGETDYSQKNIIQGQTNNSLNSVGISTINSLAIYISKHLKIQRIFSSDLLRCIQSCEIIRNQLHSDICCSFAPSLREISLGIFEGHPMKELNYYRYKSGDYNSFVPEKGESFNQLTDRVESWFYNQYNYLDKALIISHRGPISVIVNGSVNSCKYDMDSILKQGIIIRLTLFSNHSYKIDEIISVVKKND